MATKETWHEIETPPEGITVAAALLRIPMTAEQRTLLDGGYLNWNPRQTICLPGMKVRAQHWETDLLEGTDEVLRIWHLHFVAAPETAPDKTVQTSAPAEVAS